MDDRAIAPRTLFGAFVLATNSNAILQTIDTSVASTMPGVRYFLTADDVPPPLRKHKCSAVVGDIDPEPEPLFVAKGERVMFYGQAIAMVLADTQIQANHAAKVRLLSVCSTNLFFSCRLLLLLIRTNNR